jgi:hypothetical protein
VNLFTVVSAQFLLFVLCPGTHWLLNVAPGILAADHEADLSRWVGGDRGVRVLGDGENLLAVFLELGDEFEVKPLVFGCGSRWKH